VRSPNSATRITVKLVAATRQNLVLLPLTPMCSSPWPLRPRKRSSAPARNKTATTTSTARRGSRVSRLPTATAKATWSAKAAAAPAKKNPGRYRLPRIKLASAVLSGSSAGKSNAKTVAATARLTGKLLTS